MGLSTELSSDFPSIIRSRGGDYFRSDVVKIKSGNQWRVEAVVRGSDNYKVVLQRVTVADEPEDEIVVRCSCPYFDSDGPCKHIWAVILAADEKNYLRGRGRDVPLVLVEDDDDDDEYDEYDDDDESDDDPFISNVINLFTQTPSRKGGASSWKEQLASLGRTARSIVTGTGHEWSPARRIVYVIDVPVTLDSQHLILDTLIQDRRQDGEWGKPRKQRIPRWQIGDLPEPDDRQIFAMLAGSREQMEYSYYGYNYQDAYDTVPVRYRLTSPLPQIILPLIARTDRCFLKLESQSDEITEAVWSEGEPWRFSVRVRRDDGQSDRYIAEGVLERGGENLDFAEPVLMLQGGLIFTRESIAALDDGGAFHWISILRRAGALSIPENQIGEFMTEALRGSHPPRLDLPEELRYEEITARPQPCLTFKAQKHNTRLRARLSFDYAPDSQGCILEKDDPRRGVYEVENRRYILRDTEAERAAMNHLTEIGLKYVGPTYHEKKPGWEVAPTKLPRIVRELVAEGWHVEAEGKTFRNPGEIKVQVSSGIDWFELHGSVDFGGTSAMLPELLAALKRGDGMVKLGDGTYGMLPEEWMKKYGLIAGLGEAHEDHLRFRKTQIGVLDALLAAQPEADFDEAFARARDELKRFDGIKPADPPEEFIGELRPYQKDGLGWINFLRQFGFGGCLADDMGLGKTVQVLALLEERRRLREETGRRGDRATGRKKDKGERVSETAKSNGAGQDESDDSSVAQSPRRPIAPSLVVVPKSLVFNWKAEAARFTPKLRVLDHTGQLRQKESAEHFDDYDLILTTYGTLRNDAVVFKDLRFDYIILDEAQAIKNADTASAKAARLLQSDHRLTLSGTPVENHLGELWSMFEFLNPGMLGAASVFKLTGAAARNPDAETRKLLAQALRPFILRRTKDQVAKDLPAKQEQTIFCELEPKQRKLYNELRDHYRNTLLDRIARDGIAKSKMHVLEALLRLRQAALHPGLIDKKRVKEDSAKLDMLLPQLIELFEENHKVLVFSQFTSFLSILRGKLDKEKIEYEYLDGKTRDRQARVEKFQNDPDCKLFLISLKAGGLGLNLTAAEYVYLLDPWWNPAVEAQAIDRAHRIGQTRQVFAYRIIARETVEEKVLALQRTKRDLADAIINADNSLIRNLAKEDLELLLS
ncbi:MAG: SNF2-related protein [Blastocatellales bacterium]